MIFLRTLIFILFFIPLIHSNVLEEEPKERSKALHIISIVVGWLYFVAWSISFYPQLILNFQRKSVVGLSFDFISLNILGFFSYTVFNGALYFNVPIQKEYIAKYGPPIPVQLNDFFFALHAALITCVTIAQCLFYERGNQKVSTIIRILLALVTSALFFLLYMTLGGVISWLTYMYVFSYVKLGASILKYIPQAYFNYKRKSTEGWSIGNILLDLSGGMLSFLQMVLDSIYSGNWGVIWGDIVKIGLAFLSIFFDLLFIVQHYVLYKPKKNAEYTDMSNRVSVDEPVGLDP